MPGSARPARVGVAWLGAAFAAYAALYIARLSFVIDGVRYFTLADDQMISMRYAENLAHGAGLVWNAGGARVEGYTNFLWVVFMALFHWLGVPRPTISACIQASGAAFLLANLVFVRAIALRVSDVAATRLALVLVAFYIPLDNWAFQGTEVSLLTLVVTAGAWWTLQAFDTDSTPWRLFALLGMSTLVRPDMVVFCGVSLLAVAIARPIVGWRRLAAGVVVIGAFVAAATVFRLWYFGDPLPNTYYLKVTGLPLWPKVTRGAIVALLFFAQLLPIVVPLAADRTWRRPSRDLVFVIAVFAAQVLYSVSVGGDAWEVWGGSNRFIAIAMPLFFICAAPAVVDQWNRFAAAVQKSAPRVDLRRVRWAAPAAALVLVLVVNLLALSVGVGVPTALRRMILVEKPYETASDEWAVRAALQLRDLTTDRATIAVTWAGSIPYFSERRAIDLLGKMDPRIAHEPMHPPQPRWSGFRPGHMKWDYAYSIGELQPDVVQYPLWPAGEDVGGSALARKYAWVDCVGVWWARRESPDVVWPQIDSRCAAGDEP